MVCKKIHCSCKTKEKYNLIKKYPIVYTKLKNFTKLLQKYQTEYVK